MTQAQGKRDYKRVHSEKRMWFTFTVKTPGGHRKVRVFGDGSTEDECFEDARKNYMKQHPTHIVRICVKQRLTGETKDATN